MRRITLVLLLLLMLCGCGKEIDDIAYVVAIGVDKADMGYNFTFAIGNPEGINGGEEGTGGGNSLITEQQSGMNIFTAGDAVSARIGQDINFSHAELLVFSEEVAAEGVSGFVDALTRNLNQRPKLVPVVSKNSASESLKTINSKLEGNPEKYLKKIFESSSSFVSSGVDIRAFLCSIKNPDSGIAVSAVNTDSDMTTDGMAVFNGDRFVGEFDDVYIFKLMTGNAERLSLDIGMKGTLFLTQRIPPNVKVSCTAAPQIDITVNLDATVASLGGYIDKVDLYTEAERILIERMNKLAEYSAEIGVDVFGFSKYGRKCFSVWDDWRGYNWNEKYKSTVFNVNVVINPEKTGLIRSEG